MSDLLVYKVARKKDWALNSHAFHRLLTWLDQGTNSNGEKYLEMRQRLLAYFDRKNCLNPEDLVDDTLNRVARRLEEEGFVESDAPAKYCYIVARFVFMEYLRRPENERVLLDDGSSQGQGGFAVPDDAEENELKDRMLNCLEQCTAKLSTQNQDIITRYYVGKERVKIENRRALAASLGITMNALSIRACRIRDRLESCVRQCAGLE